MGCRKVSCIVGLCVASLALVISSQAAPPLIGLAGSGGAPPPGEPIKLLAVNSQFGPPGATLQLVGQNLENGMIAHFRSTLNPTERVVPISVSSPTAATLVVPNDLPCNLYAAFLTIGTGFNTRITESFGFEVRGGGCAQVPIITSVLPHQVKPGDLVTVQEG